MKKIGSCVTKEMLEHWDIAKLNPLDLLIHSACRAESEGYEDFAAGMRYAWRLIKADDEAWMIEANILNPGREPSS